MKIVLSSGHGTKISGAVGLIDEHDEAVRVVNKTAEYMRRAGIEVITYEDTISTTQDENLERIVSFHNAQGAHDWDLSVHFNSSNGTTSRPIGTEVFYYSDEDMAARVSAAIADAGDLIDRGAKDGTGLFFCRHTAEPALLLEICFVNSHADVRCYEDNFDLICSSIAHAFLDEDEARPPAPETPQGVLFSARGTCSWFGGPEDDGVSSSEGLAFFYEVDECPHLMLSVQPAGTTGMARRLDPGVLYVACRWNYDVTPKDMLRDQKLKARVINVATGQSCLAYPADWGPNLEETGRAADLSPALLDILGLTTDDQVLVEYPAE
jgi:hypothetical protein